jgi:hypothetical protein
MLKLPVLEVARVIYFPVPNPSGFVFKSPLAYPSKVDPFYDFPIKGYQDNKKCNRTSAVRVLDHIFRKYKIDLSLQLKSGVPTLIYSWTQLLP